MSLTYRENMRIKDPEAAAYWDGRDALSETVINIPEDIPKLPWHGNHASDSGLFKAVHKYVHSITDPQLQKQALHLMVKYGMGVDEKIMTDEALDRYLQGVD